MNPNPHGAARLPIVILLFAAVAAGAGLWAGQRWQAANSGPQLNLSSTVLFPEPRELPAFQLRGGDGRTIDAAALRGRWNLVFIGFTHCPDVCPTTLTTLAQAQKRLVDMPADRQPRLLFVSVDPERDDAENTERYARFFSADALGATGELPALESFARSLNMVFMKVPQATGEGYSIDHSVTVALLDPAARYRGFIRVNTGAETVAADLRAVLEQG